MKGYFLGISWKDQNTPLLNIKEEETQLIKNYYLPKKIKFNNLGHKQCVGYYNPLNGEYVGCTNEIEENQIQCNSCKYKYEFYKCVRCKGDKCIVKNEVSKKYCETPHYVYLAYFPNDKIKVGTASEPRKEVRLLEQGALDYIYIAHAPNGRIARAIESEIARMGVPTMVTTMYKMKNLLGYIKDKDCINIKLKDAYDFITNNISPLNRKFIINREHKHYTFIKNNIELQLGNISPEIIEVKDFPTVDILFVLGKIIGINNDGIKLIDTKKLEGYLFDFGNEKLQNYEEGLLTRE